MFAVGLHAAWADNSITHITNRIVKTVASAPVLVAAPILAGLTKRSVLPVTLIGID